jgi:hypothetical protein
MADGRICDGTGFAQIKPICAAPACRTEGTIPVPNGGYLGSGYGLGPITQSDLVCWPVRRPIDGRTPAILLVPAGDQVAVPAWRHGRV